VSFPLKPITKDAVPRALQKAERYRVINDPVSAESICLDVLIVDPGNQQGLITLLLAITDQFAESPIAGVHRAREVLPRLDDEYKRTYYAGIISERCAKALLKSRAPRPAEMPYHWLCEALSWYEKAEALRPPGNDEAILRWNTCARLLARHEELRPQPEGPVDPSME
jgi:hypothetical protein